MITNVVVECEETLFTFEQMLKKEGIYCYLDDPNGYVFISKCNNIIKMSDTSNIIDVLNENNIACMNDTETLYVEKKCVITLTFKS